LSVWWALLIGLAFWPASMFMLIIFLILFKWIVLYKVPQGAVPVNSLLYARWVATNALANTVFPLVAHHLRRAYLGPVVFRLLGARIGWNAIIDTVTFSDWDMINIGDNVIFHEKTSLAASFVVPADDAIGQPACVIFR